MKTFKQFQEKLTHIGDTLKKIKKDIKDKSNDKPIDPGQTTKKI